MREMFSNILAGISGIGPTDILDIVVVTYIIYKMLGFISDTRARQLVKGVGVLMIVYILSIVLHLYTLNWILKGTLAVGAIAIIILFQPELRRALEYMGRGKFSLGRLAQLDKEKAKYLTDEFVKAIDYFSATKTGALLVIERQVSLGDIAETGTILNADISAQMLGNIFYKGAPLHDGAVIIRGDKIYAAGCVLPLTSRADLNKELGTRHRAGIGITENSDAVILIVSEETGVISSARNGNLTRFLDAKEVEKLLLNLYLEADTTRRKDKKKSQDQKIGGTKSAEK